MPVNIKAKSKQPSKAVNNQHGNSAPTSRGGATKKINNAHPVGKKSFKGGPQVTTKSTKQPLKVTNRCSLFDRVKNIPLFKG